MLCSNLWAVKAPGCLSVRPSGASLGAVFGKDESTQRREILIRETLRSGVRSNSYYLLWVWCLELTLNYNHLYTTPQKKET